MEFAHDHHRETYEKAQEYLGELFDEPYRDPEDGHFFVRYGSTVLEISVQPYGPRETVVLVEAYCVQGVRVTEELMGGLLELNHTLPVGSFSLVDDEIFFSYAIFGRALDGRNLLGTIAAVATIADEYDDRIVEKYGGQTALERIRDASTRRRRQSRAAR